MQFPCSEQGTHATTDTCYYTVRPLGREMDLILEFMVRGESRDVHTAWLNHVNLIRSQTEADPQLL